MQQLAPKQKPEVHTNLISFIQTHVLLRIPFRLVCFKGYCPTVLFLNRCRATQQTAVNAEQCGKDKRPYIAAVKSSKIKCKEKKGWHSTKFSGEKAKSQMKRYRFCCGVCTKNMTVHTHYVFISSMSRRNISPILQIVNWGSQKLRSEESQST